MAESAISSVLSTLGNLAITETKFFMGVLDQVESIKSELKSMQGFLSDAEYRQSKGDKSASVLVQEIRDAAYEAENVVAKINWMQRRNIQNKGCLEILSRYKNVSRSDLVILYETGKKIEKLQKKISEIFQNKDKYDPTKLGETSTHTDEIDFSMEDDLNMQRLIIPYLENKDEVIGFHNEIDKIIEQLTDPLNKDLTFICLVGMGGIGKSTLANKVFSDPIIQNNFNALAWISVSQSYKPIELLKDIMKKIMNIKKEKLNSTENEITEHELETMPEKEVKEKLHEFLKNKKYLIVIDDVWTEKTLDQITCKNTVFPNSNNGSRIILTTRNMQVANRTHHLNHIHNIELLDKEKSWEFLRKKVFCFPNKINEITLKELENIGKELAKKCKGLPLALSVLGGVLSKNVDPDVWSRMIDNFDWEETDKDKNIVEILALSFHDLPNHLKSCFLYMTFFPEDHLISTSNLIKMWIAEGFIPFKTKYSQEETGRKYLVELAHRSMIQVVETSITHGWIKRIRMHDILHDFCIEESAKIGFFKIYNNLGNFEASTVDGMIAYRAAFNKFFSNEVSVSMPNMRTIICFDLVKPSLCGLNYLRVLALVGLSDIKNLPSEIGRMIFLKYIGLRKCGHINLPSSIGNLINLQIFDSRDTYIGNSVPTSFWKISTLKHVYLYLDWSCKLKLPNQDDLPNIQTLQILPMMKYANFKNGSAFIRTLDKKSEMSSLRLVGFVLPLEPITVLSSHLGVRELSLCGNYKTIPTKSLPNNTLFPPNLRKLKLSYILLSEDPMPILELLPFLVVLQLGTCAYIGVKMTCSSGGFRRLQHMSLCVLFLVKEWKIEAGSMPRLSKLVLSDCHDLTMQPEELVHLPALKELKLTNMPQFPKETCSKLQEIGCKVTRINE